MKALWIGLPLVGLLVAGCGAGASEAGGLPTVAASPAETPTPPATAPPVTTPAATTGTASAPSTTAPSTTAPTANAPSASTASTPTTAPIVPGQGSGESTCRDLTLSLRTSKPTYSPGETVTMTATLTNTGSSACTFSSGADHGFSIEAAGSTIWTAGCQSTAEGHPSPGFCAQFEMLQTMRPGQVLTRSQPWAQQRDAGAAGPVAAVPAGNYTASEAWAGQRATAAFAIS